MITPDPPDMSGRGGPPKGRPGSGSSCSPGASPKGPGPPNGPGGGPPNGPGPGRPGGPSWSLRRGSRGPRTRSPCVTWMFTTAGVTALTMEENPWASWGGTAAAVLSFSAGGANTSTATTTPASPLPMRKISFALMGQPSNKHDEMWAVAKRSFPVKVFAFCLMPNHFHLALQSETPQTLSTFMHWWMTSYVRRYHHYHETHGHIWQGRFKSFPVQDDSYLITVIRYVLLNPVRAGLVHQVDEWPWSSRRQPYLTDPLPIALP